MPMHINELYQCDSGTSVEFEEWRRMARTMFSDPGPLDTSSAIPTDEKLDCNNEPNLVLRVLLFFSMTAVRFLILANEKTVGTRLMETINREDRWSYFSVIAAIIWKSGFSVFRKKNTAARKLNGGQKTMGEGDFLLSPAPSRIVFSFDLVPKCAWEGRLATT